MSAASPHAARSYRVVGPIGAGAQTLLEEGLSPVGRRVALKRARRGVGPVAKVLRHEASVLGLLSHPNIVLYIETVGSDDDPQLVLEFIAGRTLRELLEQHVRLPSDVAGRIAYDLGEALIHLEERGVVHGDLSPDNVMISDAGVVKLIDFGSARRESGVVPPHATFATPGYVAPERLLGEPGDARSDLSSLGVLLYEMLTGHPPWQQDGSSRAREGRKLVPIRERLPDISSRLEALVEQLLARNPADRLPSAQRLAEALGPRVAALSPHELSRALRGESGGPSVELGVLRELLVRYVAVLMMFVASGILVQVFLGDRVARASREGVVASGEFGTLRVVARPWAEVWIDGQHVETTPFAAPLQLAPGSHTLSLKHPHAPADERDIVSVAGQELFIQKEFELPEAEPPKVDEDAPVRRQKL